MGKTWKPDKAPARKRGEKQRLERHKIRKDFAANMERAEKLAWVYYDAPNIKAVYTGGLEEKFVKWAEEKYRWLKFKEPTSKAFKDMAETWREIVITREACAKATEARTYAKGKEIHRRAVAAFRERQLQKRTEREAQC